MRCSLIVATDKNYLIGKGDRLPWHYSEDMKWFVEKTVNKGVVFGSTTMTGIGRPLPKRENYCLSRSPDTLNKLTAKGVNVFDTFSDIVTDARIKEVPELVVCGGSQIYGLLLDKVDTIYLTQFYAEHEGDIYLEVPLIRELGELNEIGQVLKGWTLTERKDIEDVGSFKTFIKTEGV